MRLYARFLQDVSEFATSFLQEPFVWCSVHSLMHTLNTAEEVFHIYSVHGGRREQHVRRRNTIVDECH